MDGHRPRKRFSQNFLHDAHWIGRIVEAIAPRPGDRLIEIGPGMSALTAPLIEAAGHLSAVEIDRDLAQRLRDRFPPEQLHLTEADALEVDWQRLIDAQGAADDAGVRVVGNLPYHISTPLLFALLPVAHRVRDQHFMLQKEVVDRMAAEPGGKDYGRLSVMLQLRYRITRLFVVPPGAFNPPPQVQSAIVRMRPVPVSELPDVDMDRLAQVVTAAFGQRRKTLRNALQGLLAESQIEGASVNPGARAEQLSPRQFVALAGSE